MTAALATAVATGDISASRSVVASDPGLVSHRRFSRGTMGTMSSGPRVTDTDIPDRTAIERAAQGDERAFAEFYDEVSPVVFGTSLRVLGNWAMAEEATQDVFFELWRLAARYDRSKGSPKAWAATIAHRRAVDRVRSEASSRARDEADANQSIIDHDIVVDEVTAGVDRASIVAALGHLTEAQREAVSLAFYGGHTYPEVAAMLNVPEGTIKSRIRSALIRLRDLMGAMP
jgi:RNA polymerase sigma-70 factor, ECF subfamily